MPFLEPVPAEGVYSPPTFNAPNWEAEANVCLILVTDADPTGFLIWQTDDDLALIPTTGIRRPVSWSWYKHLAEELKAEAKAGVRARECRLRILGMVRHRAIVTRHLPDLLAEIEAYTSTL